MPQINYHFTLAVSQMNAPQPICSQIHTLRLLASEVSARVGVQWKTLYCLAYPYLVVCIYILVSQYLPYVHTLESTRNILGTQLEKDVVVLDISRKLVHINSKTLDMPCLEMVVNE